MMHLARFLLSLLVLAGTAMTLPAAYVGAQEATPDTSLMASAAKGDFTGTIDIGGRALFLTCQSEGAPTVIIDHGQWGSSAEMLPLLRELSGETRVCLYDRAGMGQSDPPASQISAPRTAADVVTDLHDLLGAADVPGPYVLVGQSAGGAFVQLYARTYPDDVAGVVAMNAVPPADPWLEESAPLMTEDERTEELGYYAGGEATEDFDWNTSFAQLDAAGPPPAVPFLVLISTAAECESADDICGRTHGVYEAVMEKLATQWPQGQFAELEAGHEIYYSPEAVEAIRQLIAAVRDPSLWVISATPLAGTSQPQSGASG
jgi:pimeloyl-ACP methyl ester carboxylesterase